MSNMYKVENPVYQDYDDIVEKYKENMVVMTNIKRGEHNSILGGIVRYYGNDRKEITNKWGELTRIKKYGDCKFEGLFINTHIVEFYPLGPGGMYL